MHESPAGKQRVRLTLARAQLPCTDAAALPVPQRDGLQKPNTLSSLTIKQLASLVPDPTGTSVVSRPPRQFPLQNPTAPTGDTFIIPGRPGEVNHVRILGRIVDLLDEVRCTSSRGDWRMAI